MKIIIAGMIAVLAGIVPLEAQQWYAGDDQCPPPVRNGTYSAPYSALDHPHDFPTFAGADLPGWSCSYQRKDGVIVQFGDSRTPQQQWLSLWGHNSVGND